MELIEITEWVEKVKKMSGDPEAAHNQEGRLHRAVLHAIANNRCKDPQLCAQEALKTLEINFPRWCE